MGNKNINLGLYLKDNCDYFFKCLDLKKGDVCWNFVVITSSNKKQASHYEAEILSRKNRLPSQTKFIVIPDYNDERIGSGGATLSVLKELKEKYGCNFNKDRILIIHSGGDSKRIPQYSSIGKLFSPVPHSIFNDEPSTLFDELLISVSYIPTKMKSGALILSGDVLLLFNNLDFYAPREGAATISFKESVEHGQHHGVFNGVENKPITGFLHKQPVKVLNKIADDNGNINIDTGAVYFSSNILNSLYSLVETKDGFDKLVNSKTRLSFYGDFLYPLAESSTLEQFYLEKPEGTFCDELTNARTLVWNTLRPYRLVLESFDPAKFIHFGTSKEVHALNTTDINDYSYIGWKPIVCSMVNKQNVSAYLSVIGKDAKIGKDVYVEASYVHKNAVVGDNTIVSYLDVSNVTIPSDVVVHGLKLDNGKSVVRIFGISDNPKEAKLFGFDINQKLKEFGINEQYDSLWEADIYPVCNSFDEALKESLNLYEFFYGRGDINSWREHDTISLKESFERADSESILEWNKKLYEIIEMEQLLEAVRELKPVEVAKSILKREKLSKNQEEWLDEKEKEISFVKLAKVYHFIAYALDDSDYINKAYLLINKTILNSYHSLIKYNDGLSIQKDETLIKMPLRINFGGGWTDTPPYCIEHGGTVLNTAILLNGELPVSVSLKKINENKIILRSDDMNAYGEFNDILDLQDTGNPFDEFALQKAALIATGVIPISGGDLNNILNRLGGGFIMQSEVTNVPKGSGLGTSSILSSCCVRAISDFFGIGLSNEDVISTVICVEQIMSTGGGWQDQVGGLYPGLKLIKSKPGVVQQLNIENISLKEKTINELNDRLVLISTGQRRLARNLLRSVLSNYLSNNPDTLFAMNRISALAEEMKKALLNDDIDLFGQLMNKHWEMSKKIDSGSTNELIEQIFESISDLICGQMVVGAGGGGFLQVVLKQGVVKEQLKQRIEKVFKDTKVSVYTAIVASYKGNNKNDFK